MAEARPVIAGRHDYVMVPTVAGWFWFGYFGALAGILWLIFG